MNIFCMDSKVNTDIFYSVKMFPCKFSHNFYLLLVCTVCALGRAVSAERVMLKTSMS